MNELARFSLRFALLVVVALVGCAPEGARPCRSNAQCEREEECVFDDPEEAGVCLATLASDDGGSLPIDGEDGGAPGTDAGGTDAGGTDAGGTDAGDGGGFTDGGSTDGGVPDAGPRDNAVNDITVGGGFACARTYTNHAYCWGYNRDGQLGNPNDMLGGVQQPKRVAGLSEVRALAAAENHACAIGRAFGDDGVYCWGASAEGELGGPTGQSPGVPHRVPLSDDVHDTVVDLETGPRSTCVRTSDNDVWCWGPGVPDYIPGSPVKVTQLSDAMRLHVSDGAICAKLAGNNVVRCLDQIGILRELCDPAAGARQCDDLYNAESFHFTASNACRIDGGDTVGALFCGGDNLYGVAHPSTPGSGSLAFTPLEEWLDFSSQQVSLGDQHACALGNDGVVRCWGRNLWSATGQVENVGGPCANGQARCHEPMEVPDLPYITDLDTYRFFTCAISDDGFAWCWGGLGDEAQRPARWVIPD